MTATDTNPCGIARCGKPGTFTVLAGTRASRWGDDQPALGYLFLCAWHAARQPKSWPETTPREGR